MIQTTTLPNGIRVVTDNESHFETVTLGVWVGVGSRFETPAQNGYSHFLEHMCFKGTPTRTAHQITEPIETAGGYMNANTDIDRTAYYAKLLKKDFRLGLDIIADMVQHASVPAADLEKEKGVIIQEINMYNDMPDVVADDLFMARAYPDQAVGRPIIGPAENIRNATSEDLLNYMHANYTSHNWVVSAAGNVNHDAFADACAQLFRDYPNRPAVQPEPARYVGGDSRKSKKTEQVQFNLGFAGPAYTDDDFYAAKIASLILGGGFTSRLFREIREKRGLVYTIHTSHRPLSDTGFVVVSGGTGEKHVGELMPVLCDEIVKLPDTMKEDEIARAKELIRAEWLMSSENAERRANMNANDLLKRGKIVPLADKLAKLEAVSAADLTRVARQIFAGKPTLAVYGPIQHVMEYDALCGRLDTRKG